MDSLKYAFYGHHKCATMSLNTLASAVCRRLGVRIRAVYDEQQFKHDLAGFCASENVQFLAYGNADYSFVRNLPPHRGFHIIRDPRDIVVSAYYSHMYSHPTGAWPELEEHRALLQTLPEEEGLLAEIRFRARSFEHMLTWNYAQDGILEIRFEDLANRNYETLLKTFAHLGLTDSDDYRFHRRIGGLGREIRAALAARTGLKLPVLASDATLPAAELLLLAWRNRFEAKSKGRQQGKEDVASHYRKGKSGDWRTHFSMNHIALFKELYPGLVPTLGYAADDNW